MNSCSSLSGAGGEHILPGTVLMVTQPRQMHVQVSVWQLKETPTNKEGSSVRTNNERARLDSFELNVIF